MLQYLGKFSGMNPLDLHTIAVYTYPEEREKIEATASSTNSDPSKKNRKWVKLLRNSAAVLRTEFVNFCFVKAEQHRNAETHADLSSDVQYNSWLQICPFGMQICTDVHTMWHQKHSAQICTDLQFCFSGTDLFFCSIHCKRRKVHRSCSQ